MRSELFKKVTRIVVKLGTGVLTNAQKQPHFEQMEQLVAQVAREQKTGKEVLIVTSGAVGAGMGVLGFNKRPPSLELLQACAAIGQSRLMATYERLFAQHDLNIAQVLLTHDDLQHHERHLNARNTLVTLLRNRIIPIVNENDAVSVTELKFGDNDRLSALVACLLPADLLLIATTVDGFIENFGTPQAKTVSCVDQIDASVEAAAGGTASATAVGGMATKIHAAKIAVRAGIPLVVASGLKKNVLRRVLDGEDEGTLFAPSCKGLKGRKRWIAFFHHPQGTFRVDPGAQFALRERGTSLLRPGITRVEGCFEKGDVVRICDSEGSEFARGLSRLSSSQCAESPGSRSVVVHRDDLVVF